MGPKTPKIEWGNAFDIALHFFISFGGLDRVVDGQSNFGTGEIAGPFKVRYSTFWHQLLETNRKTCQLGYEWLSHHRSQMMCARDLKRQRKVISGPSRILWCQSGQISSQGEICRSYLPGSSHKNGGSSANYTDTVRERWRGVVRNRLTKKHTMVASSSELSQPITHDLELMFATQKNWLLREMADINDIPH